MSEPTPDRALVIRPEWLERILAGEKTWEIRGAATHIRGRIGLIGSGSGEVSGEAELVDCLGPLTYRGLVGSRVHHRVEDVGRITYAKPHAWVLRNAKRLRTPIPYTHPQGAVIWVRLPLGRVGRGTTGGTDGQ
jgi:hypothetical protein